MTLIRLGKLDMEQTKAASAYEALVVDHQSADRQSLDKLERDNALRKFPMTRSHSK